MLHHIVDRVGTSSFTEFTLPAVVRYAIILATFTGSRVSEYAQTQAKQHSPFAIVSINSASGIEGGKPIAFTASDFQFYSADQLELEPSVTETAAYLRVRFRYTKGAHTFTSRMFARLKSSPFCPVRAASRTIQRWSSIAPGADTPVFCYLASFFSKRPSFLSDSHITQVLRTAASKAHPDPRHLVHQHIHAISAHSLRVFACLCLQQAGWDEDTISYQLRWNSTAIKHYLRQSVIQVDAIGATLLKAALVPEAQHSPRVKT
jgi:hypothetical protein